MRPTAHRVGSLLVAALLLVSAVAGPAAATATAPTASAAGTATTSTAATADGNYSAVDFVVVGASSTGCVVQPVGCASGAVLQSYSTGVTAQDTKVSIHSIGVGEYESSSAYHSLFGNYLEDTDTIASIDARNAIGNAYEAGNTTTQADQMARTAIRDYYTAHQMNALNYHNKQVAQLQQAAEIARNSSGIDDTFISGPPVVDSVEHDGYQSFNTTAFVGTYQKTATLNNGTEIDYLVPEYAVHFDDGSFEDEADIRFRLDPLADYDTTSAGAYRIPESDFSYYKATSGDGGFNFADSSNYIAVEPVMTVQSVSGSGLESATVYDFEMWHNTSQEIQTQASTVAGNYVNGFSQDIYDALDSGEITVSQLRGIEGQVRHLSGDDDANVTDDRFQTAALTLLGVAQPDASKASTMVVEYTGYTERSRNATTGEFEVSGRVENRTYQGLLFAQNVPSGGFETETTYNISSLGGTVVMANETAGEQERFVKGEFVITSMYDEKGNQVENVTWDEPDYNTYNSTKYVRYVENSTDAWKDAISEEESTPGSGGGGVSLPDANIDTGGIFAGAGIMVIAAGAVVLVILRR